MENAALITEAMHAPVSGKPIPVSGVQRHRFLFLDALRGMAALMVCIYHLPYAFKGDLIADGTLAVDFFFCLSGFVVAFAYERRLTEGFTFRDFAVARWIRLYPTYAVGALLGLISALAIKIMVFHDGSAWRSSLLLSLLAAFLWPARLSPVNDSTLNYPLNAPAWSLFYEVAANIAYAVLVRVKLAKTSLIVCIVVANFVLLTWASRAPNHLGSFGILQSNFGLGFSRVAFSFFLGVLVCRFYRTQLHHLHKPHWTSPATIAIALVLIMSPPFAWMNTGPFRLFAISICFPVMVYFGAAAGISPLSPKISSVLGELSYPLYLLHFPLVSFLDARRILRVANQHPTLAQMVMVIILTTLAMLSFGFSEYVDVPVRRKLTSLYNQHFQSQSVRV